MNIRICREECSYWQNIREWGYEQLCLIFCRSYEYAYATENSKNKYKSNVGGLKKIIYDKSLCMLQPHL